MAVFYPHDDHVWRTIPLKYLPINDLQYTTEWARNSYSHRHLFDEATTSESYKSDSEVEDWRLQALEIMREIKHIGIAQGRSEIVKLARNHYGMTMPKTGNYKPTCIDDVMSIIEDDDWYNDSKDFKQNIIYHLMYGLTRSGMNGWLLEEERKWMQKHKLQYIQDTVINRKTKLRGFVYSIMNSQFSNSTIKLFRNMMRRKYGEFITVRKPTNMFGDNVTYTPRNFLGGSGYIVTCHDTGGMASVKNGNVIEKLCSKWVTVCKQKNVTLVEMHDMIDEYFNEDSDNIRLESKTPDCDNFDDYDKNTRCITPMTSVRKQPRMNNLLQFNITVDDDESKYMFDFDMFLFNVIIIFY